MHRRQLLIGGASLMALAGCASAGAGFAGFTAPDPAAVAEEARLARAVLPARMKACRRGTR